MGYKIVIPVIAIVSVLFTSGLALDSFAVQGPHFPIPEGKSAYFFDCSGLGGGTTLAETKVWDWMEKNNGFFHRCGYNWINAGEKKCGGAGEPACQFKNRGPRHNAHDSTSLIRDVFDSKEVDHTKQNGPSSLTDRGNPHGWITILQQFDAIFPLPETGINRKPTRIKHASFLRSYHTYCASTPAKSSQKCFGIVSCFGKWKNCIKLL